jgi:nickel-type superoxide dismutase maturation protease
VEDHEVRRGRSPWRRSVAHRGEGPTRRWRSALLLFGLSASVALALRRSLVEVRGPSMEPTLWPGDRLVTLPARRRWLHPGQVVVLDDPLDASHQVIKRITAVTGDHVHVRGDDPRRSTDGRRWGPVPAASVRRIAVTRWPAVLSPLTRPPVHYLDVSDGPS